MRWQYLHHQITPLHDELLLLINHPLPEALWTGFAKYHTNILSSARFLLSAVLQRIPTSPNPYGLNDTHSRRVPLLIQQPLPSSFIIENTTDAFANIKNLQSLFSALLTPAAIQVLVETFPPDYYPSVSFDEIEAEIMVNIFRTNLIISQEDINELLKFLLEHGQEIAKKRRIMEKSISRTEEWKGYREARQLAFHDDTQIEEMIELVKNNEHMLGNEKKDKEEWYLQLREWNHQILTAGPLRKEIKLLYKEPFAKNIWIAFTSREPYETQIGDDASHRRDKVKVTPATLQVLSFILATIELTNNDVGLTPLHNRQCPQRRLLPPLLPAEMDELTSPLRSLKTLEEVEEVMTLPAALNLSLQSWPPFSYMHLSNSTLTDITLNLVRTGLVKDQRGLNNLLEMLERKDKEVCRAFHTVDRNPA